MSSPETNFTVSPDQFSIDSMPTTVAPRTFDEQDPDLPEIIFEHPETGDKTHERSALVTNFCFNGTALLTPSAFDSKCSDLNVDTIDRTKLQGDLLILDLEPGIQYGRAEIRSLLDKAGIDLDRTVSEHIVLFRTRLMDAVLETTDEKGNPDYDRLAEVQKDRPGITPDGARELHETLRPRAIMVDNISFEPNGTNGFHATQELAAPNPATGEFTPLVYHIGNTDTSNFKERCDKEKVHIELGNPPRQKLTGYPVGVYVG